MIGAVLRVRYELLQQVSESPIFRVFAAKDQTQNREVCVRVLKPPFSEDQELIDKLSLVVKRLAGLKHPNVEEAYEVATDESATFVVGQLTRGTTLAERLRKLATFSVPAAVEAGIAICDGLHTLHRNAIAHGDLSGQTIMMQSDGDLRLQTAAFWEAYHVNSAARDAVMAASAAYLAPEVSKGALPSPASDVYAVGVILFELLTGRQPYRAQTTIAMALQHATEPVPSAKALNPSVPQPLDGIVMKALTKVPEDRYRDAGELLSDLRMLQDSLRFGKAMPWPVKAAAQITNSKTTKSAPAKPVPPPSAPTRRPSPDDSDIPVWLRVAIAFVAGLVFVIVVVFLFVNFQKPKTVKVPNIKHLTVSNAITVLGQRGLRLVRRKEEPNELVPAGEIVSTSPSADSAAYQDSPVYVTVSSGSRFVEVPDLRGVNIDKAKELLASVGLALDDSHIDEVSDRNLEAGLIVSQSPPPRGKYERNTKVKVRVSSGRARGGGSTDPEANTKYVYTIKITLSDIDQPVTLRVDLTDSHGTKTVIEERHNPGEEVMVSAEGYGSEVDFRIFYNGEPVKQVHAKAHDTGNPDNQP